MKQVYRAQGFISWFSFSCRVCSVLWWTSFEPCCESLQEVLTELWCINQLAYRGNLGKAWTAGIHKFCMSVASVTKALHLACMLWVTLELIYIFNRSDITASTWWKHKQNSLSTTEWVAGTLLSCLEAVKMSLKESCDLCGLPLISLFSKPQPRALYKGSGQGPYLSLIT